MKTFIFQTFAALCLPAVFAQGDNTCDFNNCDVIYGLDYGWFLGQSCGTDPKDGTYPEYAYQVCPCLEATWTQAATFIGANDASTYQTISSTLAAQTTTTVKFRYDAIKNTDIGQQQFVHITQQYEMPTATYYPWDVSYTNSPVTSLSFAIATSTATAWTSSITSTTTIITNTATTILAPITVQCVTGTRTVIAPTRKTTVSSTVTPRTATLVYNTQTTKTNTLSCLPSQTARKARAVDRRAGVEGKAFEKPNCGSPQTTTYTTSTSITTTTLTSTLTSTIPTTTMTTSTITPPPVCIRVRATVTYTPVITYTVLYVAARPTTKTTVTNTVTTTLVASPLTFCAASNPTFTNAADINAK